MCISFRFMVIPASALGMVQLTATARNTIDVTGQDGPITVEVIAGGLGDTIPPGISLQTSSPSRMELKDSVKIQIEGTDDTQGAGIARVGYTVMAISPTRGDTLIQTDEVTYSPARTGSLSATFGFQPFNVDSLNLPDTMVFEIWAYAVDAEGNCAASTSGAIR